MIHRLSKKIRKRSPMNLRKLYRRISLNYPIPLWRIILAGSLLVSGCAMTPKIPPDQKTIHETTDEPTPEKEHPTLEDLSGYLYQPRKTISPVFK